MGEKEEKVEAMELAAGVEALAGALDIAEGTETVAVGAAIHDVGEEEVLAGVSDITRGVDAMIVADRVAALSDIVAEAGVTDVAEGLEMGDFSSVFVINKRLEHCASWHGKMDPDFFQYHSRE